MLERNLGVRLFHRSTRKLALTEEGEAFLQSIGDSLADLQRAIDGASQIKGEPVGVLKVSMSLSFAMGYVLPALPEFLRRFPGIRPDWHFDSRQVDLVAEGFDVAIGGGFDLNPGIVSKALAPVHVVAVCAPDYFGRKALPTSPADLAEYDGILMRFSTSGRIRQWMMRNAQGDEERALLKETVVMSDSAPMIQAALAGLGIAMVAMPDALPHLESGALKRILPKWYADAGSISLYYSGRALQPLKTRAFIDFYTEHFRRERISARFAGSLK
jgi:DNA-binding transcriptional LysR family regulator